VGERHQPLAGTTLRGQRRRTPGKCQAGLTARLSLDLDFSESKRAQPDPQGFHDSFLGREARRKGRHRVGKPTRVGAFRVREEAAGNRRPPGKDAAKAGDVDQVEAEADYRHRQVMRLLGSRDQ